MPAATAVKPERQDSLLKEVCQRNTSAELQFDRGGGVVETARTRLLTLDGEHVYVDRPQSTGKAVLLQQDQRLVIHFALGGSRYAFRSRVVRSDCRVRLNASQQVVGIAIALPSEVREEQRRSDFRLSLAGQGAVVAMVHRGCRDCGGSAPIDVQRFDARLVNLSAGGVGLLVAAEDTKEWQARDTFFISLCLPEVEDELQMMMELRHCRSTDNGLSTVAGFSFFSWPLVPMQAYERDIRRFIATEQRRQIRRGR